MSRREGTAPDGRYRVEVIADRTGQWCGNGLRFETREAAEAYAVDLALRWTAVSDWRVVEDLCRCGEQPVTHWDGEPLCERCLTEAEDRGSRCTPACGWCGACS
jgi:hypothetical protein